MLAHTMVRPRVRDPRSFSDVGIVIAATVGLLALVLTFTNSRLIRLELLLFFAIVVAWVLWAIDHMLKQSRAY
jgi:hypothetical protein